MKTDTPRTDAYQYADYILNHYDRGSHEDKLCLAKSLIEHGYGRSTSKAEVERLREFIKSKLPPPPYGELEPEWKYAEKLLAETAPAPEEACKHETQNLMLLGYHWHWCSRCGAAQRLVEGKPFGNWQVPDKNAPEEKPLSYEEPTPEWRELGQGEVIQEGDEVKGVGGEWFKVEQTIGAKAGKCGSAIFRTRRPLPDPVPTQQPTQNEWRELGKDEVIREGDEEMHRDGWIWFPVATPDIGLTPSDHRNYSFRTRRPLPDPVPTQQPTQNEWRELGDDETICEGDEKFVGRGPWLTQAMYIGEKAGKYPLIRFRTRRPLPVQEQEQPYCSRCKYNHDFPCEGGIEGMPLETPLDLDIEEIEAVANHPLAPRVDFYTRQLAMRSSHAIRYLRDEIEALHRAAGGAR